VGDEAHPDQQAIIARVATVLVADGFYRMRVTRWKPFLLGAIFRGDTTVQAAVSFDGVSKKFTIDHDRSRTVQEVLVNLLRHNSGKEPFWALWDVSFDVPLGQTVGIVGDNGSGKSTALKLISGILRPTTGSIHVNGRVSALLELGAGFHPDLTGRENVFQAGTILGMRQTEMKRRFDEIVDFSELGHVIDTPVKHYSSGMYMRLAFRERAATFKVRSDRADYGVCVLPHQWLPPAMAASHLPPLENRDENTQGVES
jgi:ABC-type glutathione transport system ATPase component